jgi:hypothetical protein
MQTGSVPFNLYLSVCLSLFLPTYIPINPSIYLSICLYICVSTYLPTYLSIYPSIHLFICLSIYLSVCLSVCLSISLSLYVSTVLLLDLGRVFSFLILYRVGRTPWTGDRPVARLLPTHRINAHRHPWLEWDSNPQSQHSSERRQIMAFDRAATVIGNYPYIQKYNFTVVLYWCKT